MILALKTDQEIAEIYLLSDDFLTSGTIVREKIWPAGRNLARDILAEIDRLVENDFAQISGMIVFRGPGSFTGLRIGITVANTIVDSEKIPIVGVAANDFIPEESRENLQNNANSCAGNNNSVENITTIREKSCATWLKIGAEKLAKNQNERIVLPFYSSAPHITRAKK